jgi:hypothetical protein
MAENKHTGRNIIIGASILLLAGIGGCAVIASSIGSSMSKGILEAEQRNTPRAVEAGAAFTLGKHETLAGWTVVEAEGRFTVTGQVKNISGESSKASIHFKLRSGEPGIGGNQDVRGDVECYSSILKPGQTEPLICIPNGLFAEFDKITAESGY